MHIPTKSTEFSKAWMEQALQNHLKGAEITGIIAAPFGNPGQTADIVTIQVEYSRDTRLPTKFI
ncbi:MAG: hypothetical protein OSB45_14870, partial [Pseudomonadales bacterium]|nr:hypothetical protein [Pseudomonadales bacterium]